jgi:ribosomal-protein-alanine N-acetyltransferase
LNRVVPIPSARLRIRALTEADLDAVFAIVGDEQVTADATWRQPDLDSCCEYLARRIANEAQLGFSLWGVDRTDDGALIGLAGFFPHEDELELGYAFRADCWGHGYATEAVRAVLDTSIVLGRRVYATIRSTNQRSLSVARKVGLAASGETIEDERGTKLIFRWPER